MKRAMCILFACLLTTGCGSYGAVKGTVTYKGKKLEFGTVQAVANNGNFTAEIDNEGKYEMKGLATGTVKFVVSQPNPKNAEVAQKLLKKSKDGAEAAAGGRSPKGIQKKDLTAAEMEAMTKPQLIPEKYTDVSKPLFTYELKGGENNFDIALTD